MARALEPFGAWFTGRKRFQAATRAAHAGVRSGRPADPHQSAGALDDRPTRPTTCAAMHLRANPLVAYGYLSIGCFPCTQPVQDGEDARSGRWAGHAKVECGIHLSGLDRLADRRIALGKLTDDRNCRARRAAPVDA